MNRLKYIIVAMLVIAACFLFIVNVILRPSLPKQRIAGAAANEVAAHRVEAASDDLRDVGDLRRDPEATRSTIRSRILEHRALIPHAPEQLAEAAAGRLMLYIDPDFDEYVRQIVSFSGRQPSFEGLRIQAVEFTPENWKAFADVLGPRRVAVDQVRLRPASEHASATEAAYNTDRRQFYSRLDPQQPNLRVVHVEVPATLPASPRTTYDGFFVLTYAWDAPRQRWVPIYTRSENPSPSLDGQLSPWF